MLVFARGFKLPLNVSVKCPHDADVRHHGRAVEFDKEPGFDRGLPFLEILLGFRQAGDVVAGIAQSRRLAPAR